jgi:hypothetical protein
MGVGTHPSKGKYPADHDAFHALLYWEEFFDVKVCDWAFNSILRGGGIVNTVYIHKYNKRPLGFLKP